MFPGLKHAIAMNDWDDAERRVEKAQELFEQRRWPEALEELRAATTINPYNGGWFFNIGLTLDEMEPLRRGDRRLPAAPSTSTPTTSRRCKHLGIDLHRVGRFNEALTHLRADRVDRPDASSRPTATASSPTASWATTTRPRRCSTSPGSTRSTARTATTTSAAACATRGLYDKAIYCWQKTLDLDEHHREVHVRIAEASGARASWKRPGSITSMGLRQDPGNTDTLLDLGELLMEMGRTDEAGEKFRRAIELAPEHPAGYYCHGQWLHGPGRARQAVDAFSSWHSIRLIPARTCGWASFIYRQDDQDARKHLRAELLLRPRGPAVLMDLANLLMARRPDPGGRRLPEAAGASRAREPGAWQNLAVAQF